MRTTLLKAALALTVYCLLLTPTCNAQIISTIVGNGTAAYAGDGGQATSAELNQPYGLAIDAVGNMYIADYYNSCIRKVSTSGIISTFAGNGTPGYSGDGGQATAAEMNQPKGVRVDATGNVYFADQWNNCIRKINTLGIINTVAGNGTNGYGGDGGPATAAKLNYPCDVAIDAAGNLYIADFDNRLIRKVNTLGIITTFAGTGICCATLGDGGQATAADLNYPSGLAFDAAGNLYYSDSGFNRIRKINSSGIITTVAGNGTGSFSGDGGQATAATINQPYGVSLDVAGNIYITDNVNYRIRKVSTSGIIKTIVGNGTAGYSGDGGQATAAELKGPIGDVAMDGLGNIYFADIGNNRIRMVCHNPDTLTGLITTPSALPVSAGQVYIYRYQPGAHAGLLDTAGFAAINSNGTYRFPNLPYGPYFVEAKADTVAYPAAVSTYYSTKVNNYRWDSATFVTHRGCKNALYSNTNITIIDIPSQAGTGKISGNILALTSYGHRLAGGYNNVMGAVKSVDVKLGKKPAGGCTNRTSSDAAGNYSFTNLDTGTYVVYVDIPNFTDTIVNIHVTSTYSSFTNVNYCVDSVKVHFCGSLTSGIKLIEGNNEQVIIYPNPNNGSFTLKLSDYENTTIEVYNTIGQRVLRQEVQTGLTQLNLTDLSNGMFQLRVLKSNTPVYQTKVVKQD